MESNVCEYCGYEEKPVQDPVATPPQLKQPVFHRELVTDQTVPNFEATRYSSTKNKTLALMLCIFLGLYGVHRFYVGKIGTGILYLFTAGLFGVGWIMDIVMIANGSFTDQSNLPLRS